MENAASRSFAESYSKVDSYIRTTQASLFLTLLSQSDQSGGVRLSHLLYISDITYRFVNPSCANILSGSLLTWTTGPDSQVSTTMAPFFWQNSASKDSASDKKSTATSQDPPVQERGIRNSATAETTHFSSSSIEGRGVRHTATTETVHSGGPVTRSVARTLSTANSSTNPSSGVSSQESTSLTSNGATTTTRHAFTPAERADLSSHVIRQNGYSASTANLLPSSQLARCPVPAIPDAAAVISGAVADDNASSSPRKTDSGEEPKNGGASDCAHQKSAQEKSAQKESEQEKTEPAAMEPEKKRSEETSNTTGGGGVNFSFVVCSDASTSTSNSSNNIQESRSCTGNTFRKQTITNRAFPSGARVSDCQLSNCSGSGLRVTDCSFSNCNFAGSRITDCSFSGSALSGCRVQDCVFSGSHVVKSRVDGCRHSGSIVTEDRGNVGIHVGGGGGGGVTIALINGNDLSPEAQKAVACIMLASLVMAGMCLMFGEYDAVTGGYVLNL